MKDIIGTQILLMSFFTIKKKWIFFQMSKQNPTFAKDKKEKDVAD